MFSGQLPFMKDAIEFLIKYAAEFGVTWPWLIAGLCLFVLALRFPVILSILLTFNNDRTKIKAEIDSNC